MKSKFLNIQFCAVAICGAALLTGFKAQAAPGVLEDVPLNVGTRVQPNILLLVDDSGSMNWETLYSDRALSEYNLDNSGGFDELDFTPGNSYAINRLCLAHNTLVYDPEKTYDPWVSSAGLSTTFQDYRPATASDTVDLSNVLANPFDATSTEDISRHFYFVADLSDGVYDAGDCGPGVWAYDGDGDGLVVPHNIGDDSGDTSTANAGILTDSGGENGRYSSGENYWFVIQPATVGNIVLELEELALRSGDYLSVYQVTGMDSGGLPTGPEIARFDNIDTGNGDAIPVIAPISSGPILIRMTTRDRNFGRRDGFVMSWRLQGSPMPVISSTDGQISYEECSAVPDHCVQVDQLSAEQQGNYANWYSYHRKREYIVKTALSEIVSTSKARLGMAALHNNGGPGAIIKNLDDLSPVDPTDIEGVARRSQAEVNKAELLGKLFDIESEYGTPLRSRLDWAGRYFQQGTSTDAFLFDDNFDSDPSDTESPIHPIAASASHFAADLSVASDTPILSNAAGGTCQQNFTLLFSDGYWNSDSGFSIVDADDDGDTLYDGGTFGHGTNTSNTLADIAMNYYEDDLASGLVNNSGILRLIDPHHANTIDPSLNDMTISHQHMVTYAIAFGLNGDLTANPDEAGFPSSGWPAPSANNPSAIDDMRHAAWNGRGEFLSARSAQGLIDSLNAAIDDIEQRVGTAASASVDSGTVREGTRLYRTEYNTNGWWGDVLAYEFDSVGNIDLSSPIWRADTQMSSVDYTSRNIYSFNGSGGVDFSVANLTNDQRTDLLTNAPYPGATVSSEVEANDNYLASIVDFIKGDDSNIQFRSRENPLGAFIHSSPVYVGHTPLPYPNDIARASDSDTPYQAYSNFVESTAYTNRTPLLFVGGNGGMMHAFNADSGDELFTYIPSPTILHHPLHLLAEQDYFHKAYVDGDIVTADVYINNTWRTYLVGAMRSGGRGIYVLDITDPGADASDIVKYEFTHPELGFTFGSPQIAKMNDGSWAAIFGNGYGGNSSCNAGDDDNNCGQAKLFILNLSTFDSTILQTGAGSVASDGDCLDPSSDCNGLSSPSVIDLNGDSVADRVYAGDVHGNLWAFDVSSNNSADWAVDAGTQAEGGSPLFVACRSGLNGDGFCNSSSERQPITTKPVVRRHPYRRGGETSPNLLVFFGTGQYIAENDNADESLQSLYGVWDAGSDHRNLTRNDNLVEQTFTTGTTTIGDETTIVRNISTNTVFYATDTSTFGWYMDLAEGGDSGSAEGERVVVDVVITGDLIFFATIIPDANICVGGGSSFIMAADAIDGTQPNNLPFRDADGNVVDGAGVYSEDIITGLGSVKDTLGQGSHKIIGTTTDAVEAGDALNIQDAVTSGLIREGRKNWSIIR